MQGVVLSQLFKSSTHPLPPQMEQVMNRKIKQIRQNEWNEFVCLHANLHGDGEPFQIRCEQ